MEDSRLTVIDLASIQTLLDAACSRGAFKASEMTQVGQIYDKLGKFLNSVQSQQESSQNTQPSGETNA